MVELVAVGCWIGGFGSVLFAHRRGASVTLVHALMWHSSRNGLLYRCDSCREIPIASLTRNGVIENASRKMKR